MKLPSVYANKIDRDIDNNAEYFRCSSVNKKDLTILKALFESITGKLMNVDTNQWFASFSETNYSVVPFHIIVVVVTLITLLLGITISFSMRAEQFVQIETLLIMCLGLVAFVFDTIGGCLFAKFLNLFTKNKVNPMVGAAGISAFPMSARVIEKMGVAEDSTNHLLMHAIGANVSGQVASAVAGGIILGFFA